MNRRRPLSLGELLPSERHLVGAMQQLQFGLFERLKIANAEPVLEPQPWAVPAECGEVAQ